MRKILLLLALFATPLFGEEVPQPAAKREPPPGLEGLVWNKWDTPNFIVISLDKGQGSSMRGEAESVRSSFLERWSVEPSKRECKLVCVPDAVMLKRLFGLSEPRCEVRRSESGEPEAAIWIDADRKETLPSLVAQAELLSGDHRPFVSKGVPIIEGAASGARDALYAASELPLGSIVDGDEKADAAAVAGNSVLLCLLLRKEFGREAFGRTVSAPEPWVPLGFSSEEEFASTLSRYRANLLADMKSGRTPDGYLGVRP